MMPAQQINTLSNTNLNDFSEPGRSRFEWKNEGAFAAIKDDGSVVSWGILDDSKLPTGFIYDRESIKQVFSNRHSFVALTGEGRIFTWGSGEKGNDLSKVANEIKDGVQHLFSSRRAFAALKDNGQVVTWGQPDEGGDSGTVSHALKSEVKYVVSSGTSMAALKQDGSVVTWGLRTTDPRSKEKGGSIDTGSARGGDSSAVAEELTSGVNEIFSTRYAFAALKDHGRVIAWGDPLRGGETGEAQKNLNRNVQDIASTGTAFAALKRNGKVVTWGDRRRGGSKLITDYGLNHWGMTAADNSNVKGISVKNRLKSDVDKIYSTRYAFAAVKEDGSVVTWGSSQAGGDSSQIDGLQNGKVQTITPSRYAFAALLSDGSIVCWGQEKSLPSNPETIERLVKGGFTAIASNRYAFAALHRDGSVISWGLTGPSPSKLKPIESIGIPEELDDDVVELFSTEYAFAALKSNGSVITWGDPSHGGDSSAVAEALTSGVVSIATPYTSVSTFERVGDRLVSIISLDLSEASLGANNIALDGQSGISAKGNEASNQLVGNSGDNLLVGRAGADTLIGRGGNDTLAGGADDDRLIGGRGQDHFVMSHGNDIIEDFNPVEGDRVCINANATLEITPTDGGVLLTNPEQPGSSLAVLGLVDAAQINPVLPDWLIRC